MSNLRNIAVLAAVTAFLASPALATQKHHEPGGASPAGGSGSDSQAGASTIAAAGMMGSGMMGPGTMGPGMMGSGSGALPVMSPCLEMMGTATGMMGPGAGYMPGMMGPGAAGPMGMFGLESADHLEGRIAFLRAELGITEDQAAAWEAFADSLRGSASASQELHRQAVLAAPQASLAERLEQQAAWLALRAESLRGLKESFERLSAVLSEEQRKTAEWLLTPHFGRMPMGMI